MCYVHCGTTEWQNLFNAKISNTNYYYHKSFPVYGGVIFNKHYHGNMPILTKLVGSNFNCFDFIFIAKSFTDANKIDTRNLHIMKNHKSTGNTA